VSGSDSEIELLNHVGYHDDTPTGTGHEETIWKPEDGVSHTLESDLDGLWSDIQSLLDEEDAVMDLEVSELDNEEDEEEMVQQLERRVEHDVQVLKHWSATPVDEILPLKKPKASIFDTLMKPCTQYEWKEAKSHIRAGYIGNSKRTQYQNTKKVQEKEQEDAKERKR
jgi:hypothetical protein